MGRPNNDLIKQRNDAIYKEWQELCNQHYKTDFALSQLRERFFLEKNTIYRIVKNMSRNGF